MTWPKIQANPNWCATGRSSASCAGWRSCSRRKCDSTLALLEKLHQPERTVFGRDAAAEDRAAAQFRRVRFVGRHRIDQYGASITFNEGYSGVSIGQPFDCFDLFFGAATEDIQDIDLGRQLKSNR